MSARRTENEAPEAAPAPAPSPWRLLVFVFVSGAVLMSLEIMGSRILARDFGHTAFIWGALISVFLGALALGYHFGGILADKRPDERFLGLIGMVAGGLILLLPGLGWPICAAIEGGVASDRWGPLLAALILFLPPSFFLGMASPYAVRLLARQLGDVGKTAGSLYALSTAGSILGTLVTAFVLIPARRPDINETIYLAGALELAVSVLLLFTPRRPENLLAAGAGVVVAALLYTLFQPAPLRPQYENEEIIYHEESTYHHIQVVDARVSDPFRGVIRERRLVFGHAWQSRIDLDDPAHPSRSPYTDSFMLPLIFRRDIRRVLIIGAGGGSGPRKYIQEFPEARVDCVDIDEAVLRVCREYFFLEEVEREAAGRLRLIVADGRRFVREHRRRLEAGAPGAEPYDLVVLDAYTVGGRVPFHLTTRDFFAEIEGLLAPDGVILSNLIGSLEGDTERIFKFEYLTLNDLFPDGVYIFAVPRRDENYLGSPAGDTRLEEEDFRTETRNIILVATAGRPRLAPAAFREAVDAARREVNLDQLVDVNNLEALLPPVDPAALDFSGYYLMTDLNVCTDMITF